MVLIELIKIDKELIKVQETAENGETDNEDLELLIGLLSDDIEIKLL